MSDVTRYQLTHFGNVGGAEFDDLAAHPEGGYVWYGDYQTLAAESAALREENARLGGRAADLIRLLISATVMLESIEAHCVNERGLKGIDHADDGRRGRAALQAIIPTLRAALTDTPALTPAPAVPATDTDAPTLRPHELLNARHEPLHKDVGEVRAAHSVRAPATPEKGGT